MNKDPRTKLMVCCANGINCKNQNKELGVSHFGKQPDGTYVKKGYTAVNKMVAKSFGRWSRYPKGKPRVLKDVKNMTRKTGSKKDRSDGRRTKKKGKGKGKGKGGKGSYKRTPSPTP